MFALFSNQDKYLQQAFDLAFVLHPDRYVAWCVTRDGLDRIPFIRSLEEKRDLTAKSFKLKIPDCALTQVGVYYASDGWERGQETGRYEGKMRRERPVYKPTVDDLVVRYIKLLILETMNRDVGNVAVGLGSLLFTYSYSQICSLAPDLFSDDNIRRDKARLLSKAKDRFSHAKIISDDQKDILRKLPDEREKLLVQNSLKSLAPKVSSHEKLTGRTLDEFYTYFQDKPGQLSWEGNHLLIDPDCAGFHRFVAQYNSQFSQGSVMKLDDPQEKLAIPAFAGPDHNENNRFLPPSLTPIETQALKKELSKKRRFSAYLSSGQFRVCVDGVEKVRFSDDDGKSAQFSIPLTASYVEVFADEEERDLLVAFFPLHSLDAVELGQSIELRVKTIGKARMSCAITPEMSDTGDITAGRMMVRYEPTGSSFSQITSILFWPFRTLSTLLTDATLAQVFTLRASYSWVLKTALVVVLSLSALYLGSRILTSLKNPQIAEQGKLREQGNKVERKNETALKFDLPEPNIARTGHDAPLPQPATEQAAEEQRKGGVATSKNKAQSKIATKSPTPATETKNPVLDDKINADTTLPKGPTREEMSEALLKHIKAENNQGIPDLSIAFDDPVVSTPYIYEGIENIVNELDRISCTPIADGAEYLCSYLIAYYKDMHSTADTPMRGMNFIIDPNEKRAKREKVWRRFVRVKEGWIVFKASEPKQLK
jgi:hypothetical protein